MHSTRTEKVLLPPDPIDVRYSSSAAPAIPTGRAEAPRWAAKNNLLNTLAASGRFTTLARALEETHLADMLNEKGPFTVFAPTDEAFAKMPAADLQSLLADKAKLRAALGSHIVAGRVRAPRERLPNTATAVDGRKLTMTVTGGYYRVDNAQIVQTNVRASNGVIHAIDTVLDPLGG